MKKLTPQKSIRRFCRECMGDRAGTSRIALMSVFDCTAPECPLFYYRLNQSTLKRIAAASTNPIAEAEIIEDDNDDDETHG